MTTDGTIDQEEGFLGKDQGLWLFLWLSLFFLFLCSPFCISEHRRQLCWRRIKERRWIHDEGGDDWFDSAMRRQQERRQQLDAAQRRFQTTRTQEDEIREQYLKHLMENYTIKLSESDVHEIETPSGLKRSGSQRSLGNMSRKSSTTKDVDDVESQCETTVVDADDVDLDRRDSRDENELQPVQERESDSASDDEMERNILVVDFQDSNQKVYLPLPGQANDATDIGPSSRRLVSSGCAICLSLFRAEENITWSSNAECTHIFHTDCVLHWYLAVGRKAHRRRVRNNPEMSDEEALSKICEFPLACPCCRQDFCMNTVVDGAKDVDSDSDSGDEQRPAENVTVEASSEEGAGPTESN